MAYCKKGIKPNPINRKGVGQSFCYEQLLTITVRCSIVRSVSQCGRMFAIFMPEG